MRRRLTALGLLAVVLVGCSNESVHSAPVTPRITTTTTGAAPYSSGPLPLGVTLTVTDPGLEAEVTVFAVDQDVAPQAPMPPSGGHWVGADVQTCLKEAHSSFTVSWNEWSVSDESNGQYKASNDPFSEFPTPQYPFNTETLAVGECVRGWVVFAVALGIRITEVKYKPESRDPAFWFAT